MARNVDLLEGSIVGGLTSLALPIMATSLIQMAYNMTDMIWIGRLSADAVAAVGAAGMYLWLANGLAMIPRLGGQVKVAHELGAQDPECAAGYGQAAFHLGALLVVLFTAMCVFLNGPLIAFFKLNSPQVNADARIYLVIVALGFLFSFFNQIFTGLFTAMGGSVVVLRSTAVGLVGNILLDPLMIFGVGPFPRMEVAGAAAATVLAQAIVTAMFLLAARRETILFPHIHPFRDAREFLSVGPEDFVVLRERCYQMTHNSFLLHGYYNYRHLLLMRQEVSGEVKYYIGVPGNFYEREKQVARMFGFESFEGTREPAWEGDFGYYLIAVEL